MLAYQLLLSLALCVCLGLQSELRPPSHPHIPAQQSNGSKNFSRNATTTQNALLLTPCLSIQFTRHPPRRQFRASQFDKEQASSHNVSYCVPAPAANKTQTTYTHVWYTSVQSLTTTTCFIATMHSRNHTTIYYYHRMFMAAFRGKMWWRCSRMVYA